MRKVIPLVLLLALAAPAGAGNSAKLTVGPEAPTSQGAITVSFKAPRALPRGYHYELIVAVGDTLDDECTGIVTKKKFRPRRKGAQVVFRARPREGVLGYERWCPGNGSVIVTTERRRGGGGWWVGTSKFRVTG